MGGETDENVGPSAAEKSAVGVIASCEEKSAAEKKTTEVKEKKKKRGVLSRIWTGVFGPRNDDFERRLELISKEEATVLNRMRRRAHTWGNRKRQIILFAVFVELIAVGYALATASTSENWKIRAFRVLPMFLFPALSFILYSALKSFINMREQKDQKTLENLRAERQSKIDELKEKTNYYITQQLIQRYDTDPAAKAAAATVLASKLGSDSGLKLFLENESRQYAQAGKSNDVEAMQSSGLRNRKQSLSRTVSLGGATIHSKTASLSRAASLGSTRPHSPETSPHVGTEYGDTNQYPFADHYQAQGQTACTGGWLSRVAALLVGEDPTQCYALICGNCLMHNGLASKEDFPYVTYICPHCRTVNGPKIRQESASVLDTPNTGSLMSMDPGNVDSSLANFVEDTPDESSTSSATDEVDNTEISASRR